MARAAGRNGTAAGLLAVLLALHVPAAAAPAPADLRTLQEQLDAATRSAAQLAAELQRARSRDGGLRAAVEDLQEAQDDAQRRLDARVREAYIAAPPAGGRGIAGWTALTAPGASLPESYGRAAGARVAQELVDEVAARAAAARAAQVAAEGFQAGLRAQAAAVLAEQDRARVLLAQAREALRVAEQQAARRRTEQRAQEAAQRRAQREAEAQQARVALAEQALDAVSASVTAALAPAQTARGRRASTDAEPVLVLLEETGAGYPAGFVRTGRTISGTASWYGPGFVGSPTASGRPYDPERLSCAHKDLPLGTVLHVTGNGRATNCLVDDRGPYVGDRVLDLSRAASRALGYDGTAEVVAEVLAPQTSSPSR